MKKEERERFLSLLGGSCSNEKYKNAMKRLKATYKNKIKRQELTEIDIVDAFDILFSEITSKYNWFDQSIESLIETIKNAAEIGKAKDPFEPKSMSAETASGRAAVIISEAKEIPAASQPEKQEVSAAPPSEKQEAFAESQPESGEERPSESQLKKETEPDLAKLQEKQKEKSNQPKLKEGVGVGRSSTGDLSYELYGTHYEGTQSDLMIMSIGKVLKNNPEIIDEAIESFTCLSDVIMKIRTKQVSQAISESVTLS